MQFPVTCSLTIATIIYGFGTQAEREQWRIGANRKENRRHPERSGGAESSNFKLANELDDIGALAISTSIHYTNFCEPWGQP